MTQVRHAVPHGTVCFLAHNLETDDRAIVITAPIPKDWTGHGPDTVIDTLGAVELAKGPVIDLRKRRRRS